MLTLMPHNGSILIIRMSKIILFAEKLLPISSPPVEGYALIIEKENIVDVEAISSAEKRNPYAKRIKIENAVIMPGLINLHTHLELSGLKGKLSENMDFFEWIKELVKQKMKITKREYWDGVHIGMKEMISTGTTAIGEITSESISPYIINSYGVRGKVFYEVIWPSEFLASYIWFKKKREFKRFNDSELLHAGISPHSCYSLSKGLLKRVSEYTLKNEISLSSHISETEEERKFIKEGKGEIKEFMEGLGFNYPLPFSAESPIKYFKKLGLLRKNFIAAHAIWVDNCDIEIMKESSISVAHCPVSNTNLKVGKAPVTSFIKEGINVGLGTDSLASSNSLNMWDEMRMAYKLHRENGMTPFNIFKMATINGAKALGLEEKVGTLEVGKKADIIAVKMPENSSGDIFCDLIRETKGVHLTMVSGKILYQEGTGWN